MGTGVWGMDERSRKPDPVAEAVETQLREKAYTEFARGCWLEEALSCKRGNCLLSFQSSSIHGNKSRHGLGK